MERWPGPGGKKDKNTVFEPLKYRALIAGLLPGWFGRGSRARDQVKTQCAGVFAATCFRGGGNMESAVVRDVMLWSEEKRSLPVDERICLVLRCSFKQKSFFFSLSFPIRDFLYLRLQSGGGGEAGKFWAIGNIV